MAERTHPSQADEALRQATAPSQDARDGLTAIAKALRLVRADGAMSEPTRMARALSYATDAHRFRTAAADALNKELLEHLPRVDGDITRGEYALRLLDLAKA